MEDSKDPNKKGPLYLLSHLRHEPSPKKKNNKLELGEITPELAAQVVSQYLLPMFQSDQKNYLRKKYQINNKSTKNKTNSSEISQISENLFEENNLEELTENKNKRSIYGELKLSEQLMTKLKNTNNELEGNKLALSEAMSDKEQIKLSVINTKIQLAKVENEMNEILLENDLLLTKISNQKLQDEKRANEIIVLTEEMKKNTSNCNDLQQYLQTSKELNDSLKMELSELKQHNSIIKMEREIMADEYQTIHSSNQSLGTRKFIMDKYINQISEIQLKCDELAKVSSKDQSQLAETVGERDKVRDYVKTVVQARVNVLESNKKLATEMREKTTMLESELKIKTEKHERIQEEYQKLEKKYKMLCSEREKMRARIIKMRMRKKVSEVSHKICKYCGKEYLESENFNWSCRTHRGEWGGTMWWCCGKSSREAPGCKYSKHASKEDEDDFDDQKEENEKARLAKMLCTTCGEKGHSGADCPRDPNFRSRHEVSTEASRINNMPNMVKFNEDCMVITRKMLSRMAMTEGENSFKRGALTCEDYSYGYYNSEILQEKVEEVKPALVSQITMTENEVEEKEKEEEESLGEDKNELIDTQCYFYSQEIEDIKLRQRTEIFAEVRSLKIQVKATQGELPMKVNIEKMLQDFLQKQEKNYTGMGSRQASVLNRGASRGTFGGISRGPSRLNSHSSPRERDKSFDLDRTGDPFLNQANLNLDESFNSIPTSPWVIGGVNTNAMSQETNSKLILTEKNLVKFDEQFKDDLKINFEPKPLEKKKEKIENNNEKSEEKHHHPLKKTTGDQLTTDLDIQLLPTITSVEKKEKEKKGRAAAKKQDKSTKKHKHQKAEKNLEEEDKKLFKKRSTSKKRKHKSKTKGAEPHE